MEVQGRLMQARFIEIHQVFEKKGRGTIITEYFIYIKMYVLFTCPIRRDHWKISELLPIKDNFQIRNGYILERVKPTIYK